MLAALATGTYHFALGAVATGMGNPAAASQADTHTHTHTHTLQLAAGTQVMHGRQSQDQTPWAASQGDTYT